MTEDNAKRIAVNCADCISTLGYIRSAASKGDEKETIRQILSLQEEVTKMLQYATNTSRFDRLGSELWGYSPMSSI